MSGPLSDDEFPHLTSHNHDITSPCKKRYNCIAWAAGCVTRWWWPSNNGFWPQGVPREETLDAFMAAFATLQYRPCDEGSFDPNYEKIALFAREGAEGVLVPTHAARQLPDGRWTSKLGVLQDIAHREVGDVNGSLYGTPVQFMSRPINRDR